jgi:hypothetical protein
MRLAVALASLLLLVGLAAGCGDDEPDESATAAWADSFCTATVDWTTELERIVDDLGDLSNLSSAAIEESAQEARDATDAYVEDVRDLGSPETEGGDEIESSLETLADEVDEEMAEIEDSVEDIEGLTGLATAGREVAASVTAMFTALQTVFETLESSDPAGELETAFDESDACQDLGN